MVGAGGGTRLRSKVTTMFTANARAHRPTSTSAAFTTFSVSLHAEHLTVEKHAALSGTEHSHRRNRGMGNSVG